MRLTYLGALVEEEVDDASMTLPLPKSMPFSISKGHYRHIEESLRVSPHKVAYIIAHLHLPRNSVPQKTLAQPDLHD